MVAGYARLRFPLRMDMERRPVVLPDHTWYATTHPTKMRVYMTSIIPLKCTSVRQRHNVVKAKAQTQQTRFLVRIHGRSNKNRVRTTKKQTKTKKEL